MRKISVVNPAAGQGDAERFARESQNGAVYVTTCVSDAERYVIEACREDPETHFFVYGGDGTVNEVINGIMKAGAQSTAAFSVVPVGTGNDLLRSFPSDRTGVYTLDVIKYGDNYAINMLNTGFDSDVVKRVAELKKKPLISGSGAYIMGVIASLASSYGQHMTLDIVRDDDTEEHIDGDFLLCAIANCTYYGGGFRAAPSASYNDGILELLLVNKVSRATFLRVIGAYKKGDHINPETGEVYPKYSKVLSSRKCKKISISGMSDLCVDGEIQPVTQTEITVMPSQIRLVI